MILSYTNTEYIVFVHFVSLFSGGRLNATKVVFLVITTHSDLKQHLTKAIELKRFGVQIFVVAVGACIKDAIKNMLSTVSYPPEKFLHRVKSFRDFLLVIQRVVERTSPGKFIEKGTNDNFNWMVRLSVLLYLLCLVTGSVKNLSLHQA